ncbi:chemokine-like protein TAFA-5 isoform X3 [Rhinolophus sinicus]|uniref:chemokine-like protein TAFA-5 isoform X3 n=1 Tax=Rhinolophus sinicus TaxID=89399 RepID=UPI003D7ACCE8
MPAAAQRAAAAPGPGWRAKPSRRLPGPAARSGGGGRSEAGGQHCWGCQRSALSRTFRWRHSRRGRGGNAEAEPGARRLRQERAWAQTRGWSFCLPGKQGQLAAGTCEIVTLDRDSSQPRRTIARQTARCACRKGQIAGTTRARPACVDARIIRTKQWCDMLPCLEGEGCDLLINRSGWTCTQPGGRIKTTTVS